VLNFLVRAAAPRLRRRPRASGADGAPRARQSGLEVKKYTTSLGCFKHIMGEGGVKLLYKGAFANSVRAIGSALVLIIYDELKYSLNK
jgi:hypothetical protein